MTAAQLERVVWAWKKVSREDEAVWERERHRSRTFSVFPDEDGMYVVRGRLDPEVGALLMRAVEAASDALYRERRRRVSAETSGGAAQASAGAPVRDTGRGAARRRADAVGLLAERALAAGWSGSGGSEDTGIAPQARRKSPGSAAPRAGVRRRRPRSRAPARSATGSCSTWTPDPGPLTAGARWRRERDIPDLVLFRALEAVL